MQSATALFACQELWLTDKWPPSLTSVPSLEHHEPRWRTWRWWRADRQQEKANHEIRRTQLGGLEQRWQATTGNNMKLQANKNDQRSGGEKNGSPGKFLLQFYIWIKEHTNCRGHKVATDCPLFQSDQIIQLSALREYYGRKTEAQ